MPSLGTVDTMQPVNAAPPNLREEMCGAHRKRQATEDEDDVVAANVTSDSPYAVFLSSLRPKTKGANLLSEGTSAGEPVVVYTGPFRKPGTVIVTTEPKPKATATDAKPKAKATAAAVTSTDAKPKTTAKPAPKDGATAATAGDAAPKPKPKKPPAPKTSETAPATPAALTSQAR
jgi:D-alanyl-D-alanine carboxypeptidase